RDFAAWRRRLGKAKRAQHRGGSLGTRSDAQPTSLPVVGLGDNRISTVHWKVGCTVRTDLRLMVRYDFADKWLMDNLGLTQLKACIVAPRLIPRSILTPLKKRNP
ncbi:MAG: hypothetical protein Q8Q28_01685, partial [Pseudomonadota bacterium]|nr:hypothetical protein [Pseudomonadota bacterium]